MKPKQGALGSWFETLHFGGRASIIFPDSVSIPFRIKHALTTHQICLPTDEEIEQFGSPLVDWECTVVPTRLIRGSRFHITSSIRLYQYFGDYGYFAPWPGFGTLFAETADVDVVKIDEMPYMDEISQAWDTKIFANTQVPIFVFNKPIQSTTSTNTFLDGNPLSLSNETFEATTQFAVCFSPPLRRLYKSRFITFNKPRLREMFCTDTWFGPTPALGD